MEYKYNYQGNDELIFEFDFEDYENNLVFAYVQGFYDDYNQGSHNPLSYDELVQRAREWVRSLHND